MFKTHFAEIALALLMIIGTNTCYAQDKNTLANKQDTLANKFPRALLVQLRSEHNRMQALINSRRYKELEVLKNDAVNVAAATIADFQDHFNFCRVYYYIDTNQDMIKNRIFNGVLLNADGTPATNIIINDTSKDYLIVFYGYPAAQSRVNDSVTNADQSSAGEPFGKGLVINNYLLHQVSFFYKLDYENSMFNNKGKNKKYIYVSKHYEMEYFPFAALLNQKLNTRQKKLRITNYMNNTLFQ